MKTFCLLLLPVCLAAGPRLPKGALTPAWVEFGADGKILARVVIKTGAKCPTVRLNSGRQKMTLRTPVPDGLEPLCELVIPAAAASASIGGQKLALPSPRITRVAVLGDTGCRVKANRIQDCSDPAKWPFERVATRAAAERPDLVLHVGDYLYREDKCPEASRQLCGAGVAGDRWAAWNADFFAPAARLLAAAPWAFSRGNHEDCNRSWRGWFYYLDPRPWSGSCLEYSEPYAIAAGGIQIFLLDSSASKNSAAEKQVAVYASQLKRVRGTDVWLLEHHPMWDLHPAASGPGPLAAAWDRAAPRNVSLVLSGHTHLFELVSPGGGRPPQLVAGDGGTSLKEAADPKRLNGFVSTGAGISGTSLRQWGYTWLTRSEAGWNLELKTPLAETLLRCSLRGLEAACSPAGSQ